MLKYIRPIWPAPHNVLATTTTRIGGVSSSPYDTFNFSLITGDQTHDVLINRECLIQGLHLPQEPFWLKQEHTNTVIEITNSTKRATPPVADASFTRLPGPVCVVLTADCIPILVCDKPGSIVGAIHAGWKGILAGVIETTITAMGVKPAQLLAWLGPAIGPQSFQVQEDFIRAFCQKLPASKEAFSKNNKQILANIYLLATLFLKQAGVTQIYGGNYCTFTERDLFYSYRRDGLHSGRMASVIWLAS